MKLANRQNLREPDISKTDFDIVSSEEGADLQGEEVLSIRAIKKRSIMGVATYALRTIVLQLINFVAVAVFSIYLKPDEFGTYGLVIAISGFFTIISDIGLGASIIQRKEEPTNLQLRTVFTVQQVLGWIVCVLIIAVGYAMYILGKINLTGFYLSAAWGLTFPIVSFKTISSLLLERRLEFSKLTVPVIFETLSFNLVAIFLMWKGYGVTSFAVATIVRSLIGVAVMWYIKPWEMGLAFSRKAFDDLMHVGLKFQLNDMLAKTKDELFSIIVRFMVTGDGYGYMQWAQKIANLPRNFTVDSVLAVTFSTYARMQHDPNMRRRAIEKTIFFVTLVAFPVAAGLSSMSYPLLHVVTKLNKWEPAVASITFFSIAIALSTISTPLVSMLNAIGKINISLHLMVMWTILQWIVTPLCIHFYGFTGVALAQALIGLTVFFVVFITKKFVSFSLLDQIWRQFVAMVIMVLVLYVFRSIWAQSLWYVIVGVVTGGIVYLGFMMLFGYKKVTLEMRSLLEARR